MAEVPLAIMNEQLERVSGKFRTQIAALIAVAEAAKELMAMDWYIPGRRGRDAALKLDAALKELGE